jgi:hypothetical protein
MRYLALAFLLVCGCGDDDPVRHVPDARLVDAPDVDAPPQPVTITISAAGAPVAGTKVYFQNADSSLVSEATTDANGQASAMMVAGGFVTSVDAFGEATAGDYAYLHTFAGVKPGDQLVLDDPANAQIMLTLTMPEDSDSNVAYYQAWSPCGTLYVASPGSGSNPSGSLYLYDCGSTTDLVITSHDGNDQVVSWLFAPNEAVADGGAVDLGARTYTAAATRTYTFSNKPGFFDILRVRQTVASSKGPLAQVHATTTGSTLELAVPAFTGAVSIVTTRGYSTLMQHAFVDWGPYASSFTADLGGRVLRDLTTEPVPNLSAASITWAEPSSGETPEFVRTSLFLSGPNGYWTWALVAPHAAGTVGYPTLPTSGAAYNLSAADTGYLDEFWMGKVQGGYDIVRARAFSWYDLYGLSKNLTVAASGSAEVAFIGEGEGRLAPRPDAVPRPTRFRPTLRK